MDVFRGKIYLVSCYSEEHAQKQFSGKGRRNPHVVIEIISEINSEEKLHRWPVLLAQTEDDLQRLLYKTNSQNGKSL
jgi:hypothetical protein